MSKDLDKRTRKLFRLNATWLKDPAAMKQAVGWCIVCGRPIMTPDIPKWWHSEDCEYERWAEQERPDNEKYLDRMRRQFAARKRLGVPTPQPCLN